MSARNAVHMLEKPIEVVSCAIKRERQLANMSASELAKKAGMSKSNLSQLEAGIGNPSIETLWALAAALGIPVSRLMEQARTNVELIRWGDGFVAYADEANYSATLLSACPASMRRDVFTIQAKPGKPRISKPHGAGAIEHLILIRGQAIAGPLDSPTKVTQGDYLRYAADVEHMFEAVGQEAAAVLIIEHAGR